MAQNLRGAVAAALSLVLAILAVSVQGSDPELTTDFFVPTCRTFLPICNTSFWDGNYFTFTGFRDGVFPAPDSGKLRVTKAFSNVFPALTGLGVSYALLEFSPKALNPPHTHPRGSEVLFVIYGTLDVGFIDSTNKLYNQTLHKGDVFVFPKGLVHYQINLDTAKKAKAIAAFSSSSPGLISMRGTLFGSNIPDAVLEGAFSTTADIVHQLKFPFSPRPV